MTRDLVQNIARNLSLPEKLTDALLDKMFDCGMTMGYATQWGPVSNRDVAVLLVVRELSHLWEGLK
jgi:hypothetical protein